MPKQLIGFVVLAGIGIAVGILIWAAVTSSPGKTPETPDVIERAFSVERFFSLFDVEDSGKVSFEVFEALYGTEATENFLVNAGPGKPALTAREAFDSLDKNGDGFITRLDFGRDDDGGWQRFRDDARRQGLLAKEYKGRFVAVDSPRDHALSAEIAAESLNQLPFHGSYFDRQYFGTWGSLELEDGSVVEGYVRERADTGQFAVMVPHTVIHRHAWDATREPTLPLAQRIQYNAWCAPIEGNLFEGRRFPKYGRAGRASGEVFDVVGFMLFEDDTFFVAEARPQLRVFRTSAVTVTMKPDHPRTQYARRVATIKFDDTQANAELAAKCVEWGLYQEAIQLYLRVLVFDPRHAAAREFMGIEVVNGHFKPKGRS